MELDETARGRLDDVRELEPTSNGELARRWGMDSGRDVAAYLRDELGDHVYRDDSKRIRARNGADVDGTPEQDADGPADDSQATVDHADGDADGQDDQSPSQSNGTGENGPQDDGETFVFAPDELDEMLTTAADEARREGYDTGVKDVRRDPPEACPKCGEPATTDHLSDGEVVRCTDCGELFRWVEEPALSA